MSALETAWLACLYVLPIVATFGAITWVADQLERRYPARNRRV
jgi:hypothetical protein